MKLSNQPYKGTLDLWGADYALQQYIFDTWQKVCERFNYQPYRTPLLESAELYRAKSGEDVGGKELFTLKDLADRELAIRPEMTPSVTRMVSRFYPQVPKPIRLYSMANFMRNERPQRGRNREFWQLNVDIFGDESLGADREILVLALELMKAFGATKKQFKLYVNSRLLIDEILNEIKIDPVLRSRVARVLDKFQKLPQDTFVSMLAELGVTTQAAQSLIKVLESDQNELAKTFPGLVNNRGWQEITKLIADLKALGYDYQVEYAPHLIRGFDYYDGMIFEVFDMSPDNNRAMFGGGRYNGLANLFGGQAFPAVGFAPGDETMKLFLQAWDLVPKDLLPQPEVFIPQLVAGEEATYGELAAQLRQLLPRVEVSTVVMTIKKALEYANQRQFKRMLIVGENELEANKILLKDMVGGTQVETTAKQLPFLFKD